MKKYCFVILIILALAGDLFALGSNKDPLLEQYLEKDSHIFSEIIINQYSMVFIAHDDMISDTTYQGDLLFLIMKDDKIMTSSLVYSNGTTHPYSISDNYFAVVFQNNDIYTDEIIYFNFNDETREKLITNYKFISGLFILNGNLYFSAEKYEKCISRYNFMTSEITEYGNSNILVADFLEYNDKVLALTIFDFPPFGKKNFTIQGSDLTEFNVDLQNLKPIKNKLDDMGDIEKNYEYLLD